ncbi:MAG: A/G-specific adenine glycosylase [Bacteroidota bacterium]
MNLQFTRDIRTRILHWYKRRKRDLQWRTTTDPYEILVSEIMLQQTQVSRVKVLLPQFLQKFPDIHALASAPKGDVLRAWKGMGYNNRAVRLREIARIIVRQYNGVIPDDIAVLKTLPGVGEYTSHAIACFAFKQSVPVVDVNIKRVLSRIYGKMKHHAELLDDKKIHKIAEEILTSDAYTWNQSLMDLGATICTAHNPLCRKCSVKQLCGSKKVLRRETLRNLKPNKTIREPVYAGIPRRFWRGRIVEALRNLNGKKSIGMLRLGKRIKKDFHPRELPWLLDLVSRLANDGLLIRRGKGRKTRVMLPLE